MLHGTINADIDGQVCDPVELCFAGAADCATVGFVLRVENFHHAKVAYGAAVATKLMSDISHFLIAVVHGHGDVDALGDDMFRVTFRHNASLGQGTPSSIAGQWLNRLCTSMPFVPFVVGDAILHIWLSGCCVVREEQGWCAGEWRFPSLTPTIECSQKWAVCYRADMQLVAEGLSILRDGGMGDSVGLGGPAAVGEGVTAAAPRPLLYWQPIRNSACVDEVFYYEALLRFLDADGGIRLPSDILEAFERLGFIRVIDQYVIDRVIDELEEAPDVSLGVNISALSVRHDAWWDLIKARLRRSPGVARRLIFEITETAAITDMAEAIKFTDDMRRLGCRFALDDFGTGHASLRHLMTISPDVVKIDHFFIRRAGLSVRDRAVLGRISQLVRVFAPIVVIEGVETVDQREAALGEGLIWQQGYLMGHPSACRPWLYSYRPSTDQLEDLNLYHNPDPDTRAAIAGQ